MGTSHEQCILHPQRRVVGVCAHCLRERLTCLIESITPADSIDGEDADEERHIRNMSIETAQEQKLPPPPRMHPFTHERSSKNIKSSADMALHSHSNLEDSLNLALQKVKHAHQQLNFAAQSPYQGVVKVAPAGSPLFSSAANDKRGSLPVSCRPSNATESDMKTFPGGLGMPAKKKGSWFSISKAKNSLLSSPLPPQAPGKLDDKHLSQKSPQVTIFAGRKSASDAIGSSCNNYRQAYMADLEAIAEINIGEAAIKVDRNEGNTDAHANSSWISSLFQRRKGSKYKADVRHSVSNNNTVIDGKVPSFMPNESIHQSPKVAIDAGRHSLDGARPNFKQILKKIEARNKHQRVDCSPMQIAEHARKVYNDNTEDMSALQKCKSVAAARSSISVDLPTKHFSRASPSRTVHNNGNTGMECDNRNDERSRWGRSWNRTLSPLLGFKNHGRRSVHDSPHQHPGLATPDHAIFKNSIGVSPSSSSYLSPLRRSKCAPDAHIQYAQMRNML